MNPRMNFLSGRTILMSLAVGALVGALLGSSVVGMVAFFVVYVLAAVEPRNHTTCPDCGARIRPRASACGECGYTFVV